MNLRQRVIIYLFLVFNSTFLFSQSTIRLSGKILGEDFSPLENATIYIAQFSTGTSTDSLGEFHLNLKSGWNEIAFSYIGYKTETVRLYLSKDTLIELRMKSDLQLSEVIIADKKRLKAADHDEGGLITLRKENFLSLPALLGENDPMRAVQMQPGIQSGNEGSRGIFVRGGSPDQNLMLLDGTPVYNPAHIYGFISVFNGDAIEQIDIYKDHYPSRFGGRLGSVMDIKTDGGNTRNLRGSVSVGLVASRFHLDGPLSKSRKTTFSLSARVCYIGLYTSPISKRQYKASGYDGDIGYYFADANIKLVHRFSDKDRMELSFFTNSDFYSFKKQNNSTDSLNAFTSEFVQQVNWSNYVSSAKWIHTFNDKWEMKHTVAFSSYRITPRQRDHYYHSPSGNWAEYKNYYDASNTSLIHDISYRGDVKFSFNKLQTFRAGAEVKGLLFETGKGEEKTENTYRGKSDTSFNGIWTRTIEASLYMEDEIRPDEHWLLNGGFHLRSYVMKGKPYVFFLPRGHVVYSPVKNFSLRSSVSGLSQNLHLLTTSSADVLNDYWVPATQNALPETGWNFSFGMMQKLPLNFEWSIDGFYRIMNNLIDYKEGAAYTSAGDDWEKQVAMSGTGRAYGVEVYAARSYGQVTGSVAYTLAWSQRKFDALNDGKYYPYKFDRRHNIALQVNYLISKHFEVGLAWVYGSGNMFTLPLQSYNSWNAVFYRDIYVQNGYTAPQSGEQISVYTGKNNYRLPPFHHLDLSFTYKKKVKRLEHLFNFSVYNVYNRYNIFSVYTDYRSSPDGTFSLVFKQLSLFPVLPSVSYTIKFGV